MLFTDNYSITEHALSRFVERRTHCVGVNPEEAIVSLLDQASSQNAKKIPAVKRRCKKVRTQGMRFKATPDGFVFLLSNNTVITCYQS